MKGFMAGVAAVALIAASSFISGVKAQVAYTSDYQYAGGSDNSDSNGACAPTGSEVSLYVSLCPLLPGFRRAASPGLAGHRLTCAPRAVNPTSQDCEVAK